jgi:hypothetical protein
MDVDAILVFFAIVAIAAALSAAASSFGADTRELGPADTAASRA